ncbi:MarR family winged helix-turn-helix transcriptional regulator [Nocardia sp. alder85J]|uniref:MarR family winged helix-turn-helix transcriptional regulator n=1 Tax=Nocardia sp. alder85J TaxID=2862949 RepID=UPI001CD502FB|nr:MarR family transcriptional regulator [Nocardia sp. alder85J]MCX4096649.1 MarR family transcriptional regulator [Nocardia sp. alder85J]
MSKPSTVSSARAAGTEAAACVTENRPGKGLAPEHAQPGRAEAELVAHWRDLLSQHAAVSCALEKELQGRHSIGLSEFECLDRLVDADCESYRMSDLAADIYLSQSALSRAVARLERDGLVTRDMCTDDRRAIFVCVTDRGRLLHAAAAPTHRAVLGETLH